MGSCAAPSAKGDDKFITTDYLQQCQWVHVQLHQQKGMISLSPPTICNSAGIIRISSIKLSVALWITCRVY
ncbi:hypothetical protein, partial [Klebsiella pneumoniae]|uniref:hypothetical protein n=1 Tax=Klebsiella pneumoniae TaxID=573 RepID=UPI001C631C5D